LTQNSSPRVHGSIAVAFTIVILLLAVGCGGKSQQASRTVTPPSSDLSTLGVHRPEELVNAANSIVRFLQGSAEFEEIRLAEKVSLYISPEGGGTPGRGEGIAPATVQLDGAL
jgi:hypothetical protein